MLNYGTVVGLVKTDEDEDGEPGKWQYKGQGRGGDWEDFNPTMGALLEREYRSGRLYLEHSMTVMGPEEGVEVHLDDRNHKVAGPEAAIGSNTLDCGYIGSTLLFLFFLGGGRSHTTLSLV